jgi:cytochrome P450
MVSVAELSLAHLPLESDALAADPLPYFEAARRQHPWLAASNLGYVVTEYQAIRDILMQDAALEFAARRLVQVMGAEATGWGRFMQEIMLARDEPEHGRLRGAVAEAFTPGARRTEADRTSAAA